MGNITNGFDMDIPEYVDEFRRYLPELEYVMVQLETNPNAQLMTQAFEFLTTLKQVLVVSTDMVIISVAESIGDLSTVLSVMIQADTYFKEFSDLVLLVFDRLAKLIRDIERDIALDFELSQTIHIVLQPLKDKVTSDTLEAEISSALKRLANSRTITEGDISGESEVELFSSFDCLISTETEEKSKDAVYKIYQEAVIFIDNTERLALETLLGDSPHKSCHSSFIVPMALTLNKMLGNPVNDSVLYQAVLFHDIGDRMLPQSIFSAKKLSALEHQLLKSHPLVSGATLKLFFSVEVVEIVEQHHEFVDGSGYPCGLSNEAICIGAKILSLCDAFDAMTQPRPHKPIKRSFLRALAEINACQGSQFDSAVVEAFNRLMQCKKIQIEAPGSRGSKRL